MRGAGVSARTLACCLALTLAGCSTTRERSDEAAQRSDGSEPTTGASAPASSGPSSPAEDPSAASSGYAVPHPGPLTRSLLTADLLVTSSTTISGSVRRRVGEVPGVTAVIPLSLASLSANGRTLTVAAADPGEFRRFTPVQSAQSDAVWSRVADGEVGVDPSLPRRLEDPKGYLRLGAAETSPALHIGAYAPMVTQISAVVNHKRARQLGFPEANALLVSTGTLTPSAVTGRLRRVLEPGTTLETLALEFDLDAPRTAVLSGRSVSSAVGSFRYVAHEDGTITPDRDWVREYVRRETVPILGPVTGNKGMLPQLRAALQEVVDEGLADRIHRGEYGGCYVPRFIAHDQAKGLSLHSWGMAVDLNVPGNRRGTAGQLDRQVVQIFKSWGFAWGGDWNYTDPMHFEMDRVVRAG